RRKQRRLLAEGAERHGVAVALAEQEKLDQAVLPGQPQRLQLSAELLGVELTLAVQGEQVVILQSASAIEQSLQPVAQSAPMGEALDFSRIRCGSPAVRPACLFQVLQPGNLVVHLEPGSAALQMLHLAAQIEAGGK